MELGGGELWWVLYCGKFSAPLGQRETGKPQIYPGVHLRNSSPGLEMLCPLFLRGVALFVEEGRRFAFKVFLCCCSATHLLPFGLPL